MPLLSFAHGSIRYVLRHENRYFVALEGSHEAYLAKFSAKTRNTFRRHLRRFADAAGGSITWTAHRTPDELRAFHADALRISRDSHQHGIGYGLPENPDFIERLADDAARSQVRGYLLFHHGTPAAYALCPIADNVMMYARLGYAPSLEELSPGRILLLLILEKLFVEKPAQYLDFGAQEFDYKSHFATDQIRTARVLYFRPNAGNGALIATHVAMRGGSRALSEVRGLLRKVSRALAGKA
jgi:CelD/BcsL family acetyltransferase involved in cellulose biosynthesis